MPFEDRSLGNCFRDMRVSVNKSVDGTGAQTFHGMDPNLWLLLMEEEISFSRPSMISGPKMWAGELV